MKSHLLLGTALAAMSNSAAHRQFGDDMNYGAIAAPPPKGYVRTASGFLKPDHYSRPMDRKDDPKALTPAEIKDWEDLKKTFLDHHRSLTEFVKKANGEIEAVGKVSAETKSAMTALTETLNGLGTRLDKVEAKANRIGENPEAKKSLGEQFTMLEDLKTINTGKRGKVRLEVKGLDLKAITNATGQNQPLVPDMRLPSIQQTPNRILTIRDLIPTGRTTSNLIQYVKENVFTNNAGPQAGNSPTTAGENLTKNESDITFTLANAPVVTIAHFILASRQVLDDAPMLQSYIDGRLLYGLKLEEEDEILNGEGTAGTLDGLMKNATAYNRDVATDTKIDTLRRSITQLYLSEYLPEVFILNPADWEKIELQKDSQGRYILANPTSLAGPTLWGKPVIPTNSMTEGQFLTANFTQAAQLWDRQDAAVEVSREDSDNFRKNMVTILAEERVALTIYRPTALIKGVFQR